MFSVEERTRLLQQLSDLMESREEFEGLLLIGSGAEGFRDQYSDIDLMAGCFHEKYLPAAREALLTFFQEKAAIYVHSRTWGKTVFGLSAYWENGLSCDLSFMPSSQIPLRTSEIKILWRKTKEFEEQILDKKDHLSRSVKQEWSPSLQHEFIYSLRRCEIAVAREEWIEADIALGDARRILLYIEAVREGKKIHQFKAWNTLNSGFLRELEQTYPSKRNRPELTAAKEALMNQFFNIVEQIENFPLDATHFKLLNRF